MSFWDTMIGGLKGVVAGAGSGFLIGGPLGALIGGTVGGAAGGVEGHYEGEARDEMVANAQKSADAQGKANETSARRNAAALYTQAAANPTNTSATMFEKARLQSEANSGFAAIKDKGNPFTPVEDKAGKQFYGKTKTSATKVA